MTEKTAKRIARALEQLTEAKIDTNTKPTSKLKSWLNPIDTEKLIVSLVNTHTKVFIIRIVALKEQCGLKEAKHIVDSVFTKWWIYIK